MKEKESNQTRHPFRFSRRAIAIAAVYAVLLAALNLWMIHEGLFKGALFGKLFGFASAVSVILVFYFAHPRKMREELARKDDTVRKENEV